MFEFAKEMYFVEKVLGDKRTAYKTQKKLLKSSAIVARSLKEKSFKTSKPIETRTKFNLPILMNLVAD